MATRFQGKHPGETFRSTVQRQLTALFIGRQRLEQTAKSKYSGAARLNSSIRTM
jgi:hypothetical protein